MEGIMHMEKTVRNLLLTLTEDINNTSSVLYGTHITFNWLTWAVIDNPITLYFLLASHCGICAIASMCCCTCKYGDDAGKAEETIHHFKEKATWISAIVITYGTRYPGLGWTLGFVLVSLNCCNKNILDSVSKTLNIYFSELWKLGGPRSRCQQIRCQVKAFFLDCRRVPSCGIVTCQREREHLSLLSSYKDSTLVNCLSSWELHPQGRITTPWLLLRTPARWGIRALVLELGGGGLKFSL